MAKYKTIRLDLENCDSIYLTKDQIDFCNIGEISKYIQFGKYINWGEEISMYVCRQVNMKLNKSADFKYKQFGLEEDKYSESTFRRIKNRDITSITLIYDDDSEIMIYVPWEDDGDEYHNKCMKCTEDEDGLTIIIEE